MIVSMIRDVASGCTGSQTRYFTRMDVSSIDSEESLTASAKSNYRSLLGFSILEMLLPCALFIIGLLGLLTLLPHTSFCTHAFYGGLLGSGITVAVLETLFGLSVMPYENCNSSFFKGFFNYNPKTLTEPLAFGDEDL